MTYTPTPAEFLASTDPDEAEGDFDCCLPSAQPDPLVSIAHSLGRLVDRIDKVADKVEAEEAEERDEEAADARYLELDQAYADLDAKYDVLNDLVEQIRTIIKPSTSKLANQVRAAIDAWANPQIPETPSPAPGDVASFEPPETAANSATVEARAGEGSTSLTVPAADAPVEEWRAYAKAVHGVDKGDKLDFTVIDQMNRSQIRTMLGIEQLAGA